MGGNAHAATAQDREPCDRQAKILPDIETVLVQMRDRITDDLGADTATVEEWFALLGGEW